MKWVDCPPLQVGYYWCFQNNNIRMLKVWRYEKDDRKYFTNELGAPYVRDPMYADAQWCGPIVPPAHPNRVKDNPDDITEWRGDLTKNVRRRH